MPSPNIWLSALAFGSGAPDGPQGQADAPRPAPWWEPGGLFAKPAPAPCSIKGWSWLQRARKPLPTLLLLRLSRTRSSTPCSKPSTMPGCEPGGITLEQAQAQGCNQIPVQAVQIPLGAQTRAHLAGFWHWAPSPGPGRAGEEQKQSWPRGDSAQNSSGTRRRRGHPVQSLRVALSGSPWPRSFAQSTEPGKPSSPQRFVEQLGANSRSKHTLCSISRQLMAPGSQPPAREEAQRAAEKLGEAPGQEAGGCHGRFHRPHKEQGEQR